MLVRASTSCILSVFAIAALSLTGGADQKVPLLNNPISSWISFKSVPLSEALSTLGQHVEDGFVLFGLEVKLEDGKEPTVTLEGQPGMKLGDAITQVLKQLPDYEMEVVSDHLINLRPSGAKQNPENILNLRVGKFDAVSMRATMILNTPWDVIPELNEALIPKGKPGEAPIFLIHRGYQGGSPITLHLKDVMVREILNAASKATEPFYEMGEPGKAPSGWVYTFDPHLPKGYSQHAWRRHFGLPLGWRAVRDSKKNSKDK